MVSAIRLAYSPSYASDASDTSTKVTSKQVQAQSQTQRSTQASAPPPPPKPDTIKLSASSKVASMKQRGDTVSQIAASLGLSAAEVDADLSPSSSVSTSQASILAAFSSR